MPGSHPLVYVKGDLAFPLLVLSWSPSSFARQGSQRYCSELGDLSSEPWQDLADSSPVPNSRIFNMLNLNFACCLPWPHRSLLEI